MLRVVYKGSFPDAKVFEYVSEDFVGGDGASEDVGEMVYAKAEVFGNEVAAESHVHGLHGTLNVGGCGVKGLLVALVGYDYLVCACIA